MKLETIDAVFYTLTFLAPGFILSTTLSKLVPVGAVRQETSLLRYLTLSLWNYALWSPLIYLILKHPYFLGSAAHTAIGWGVIAFVGPLVIGVSAAAISRKGLGRRILQWAGLIPLHGIPTAWDYVFWNASEPAWILVTMIDGSTVGGVFGNQSFASSEGLERDLFIQEVWDTNGPGPWKPREDAPGILIAGNQIRSIELRHFIKEVVNEPQSRQTHQ